MKSFSPNSLLLPDIISWAKQAQQWALLWDWLPGAPQRKPGCSQSAAGCTQMRELLWSSSPSELGDTGRKRLRKSRKETTHPAQSVLNLAWEHPLAVNNQETLSSAKPLPIKDKVLEQRLVVESRNVCGCTHTFTHLHLNEQNKTFILMSKTRH